VPTDEQTGTDPEETVEANVPTDEQTGTDPEETVEANVPTDEQTGTETTPEGPIDPVAMLKQQPLVGGQVEVNRTILTCQ